MKSETVNLTLYKAVSCCECVWSVISWSVQHARGGQCGLCVGLNDSDHLVRPICQTGGLFTHLCCSHAMRKVLLSRISCIVLENSQSEHNQEGKWSFCFAIEKNIACSTYYSICTWCWSQQKQLNLCLFNIDPRIRPAPQTWSDIRIYQTLFR